MAQGPARRPLCKLFPLFFSCLYDYSFSFFFFSSFFFFFVAMNARTRRKVEALKYFSFGYSSLETFLSDNMVTFCEMVAAWNAYI